MIDASTKAAFEGTAARPGPLAVEAAGVPDELRRLPQWVCWRYERSGDKWTKVPINAGTGARAKSNDPATWRPFDAAVARLRGDATLAGVGFAFADDGGLCGVDLDDAVDPATEGLKPWAARIVAELGAYTELSPSGTGVKLFLYARKPDGKCKKPYEDGEVEVYERGRWFAVTGRTWPGTPGAVESRQDELDVVYERVFGRGQDAPPASPPPNGRKRVAAAAAPSAAERAVKYLDKCDPAVSGQGGHDQTFAVARAVVYGFDLGPEAGFDLLWRHYNPRCQPPWTEAELRHKCHDAHVRPFDKQRGWLLKGDGRKGGTFHSNGQATPAPPAPPVVTPTPAPPKPPDGLAIILKYFHEKYDPTFRRSAAFYSNSLGREVMVSAACYAPTGELVERLKEASDAPCDKHRVVYRDQLPKFFQTWAKVAAMDLMDSLPEEDEGAEVAEGAGEEFRAKVAAALHTIVAMGYQHRRGKEDKAAATEVQRRSLLDWCVLWAKDGRWASLRSYQVWTKREGGRYCIAIRPELFGQVGKDGSLGSMGQNRFGRLCERYGVGAVPEQKIAGVRCVELAAEFIESMLACPAEPPDPAKLPGPLPIPPPSRVCEKNDGISATPGEKGGERA